MRGGVVVAVVVAAVVACLLSCHRGGGGAVAVAEEGDTTVYVGYVPTVAALPLFVAAEQGFFAEEGVAVVLVPFSAAMDIDTALVGGSVAGAMTDIFRVAYRQRKDSVTLVPLRLTAERWYLVSSAGARLSSPQQMGDKMVAMTRYSATDYLCDCLFDNSTSLLPTFKVQINDVSLRREMVEENIMDAAWLPAPHATMAARHGHKIIYHGDSIRQHLGVLAVREGTAGSAALVRAYDRACDTINKYGVATYAPQLAQYCDIDSATLHHLPPTLFPSHLAPDSATVSLAHRYVQHD